MKTFLATALAGLLAATTAAAQPVGSSEMSAAPASAVGHSASSGLADATLVLAGIGGRHDRRAQHRADPPRVRSSAAANAGGIGVGNDVTMVDHIGGRHERERPSAHTPGTTATHRAATVAAADAALVNQIGGRHARLRQEERVSGQGPAAIADLFSRRDVLRR